MKHPANALDRFEEHNVLLNLLYFMFNEEFKKTISFNEITDQNGNEAYS